VVAAEDGSQAIRLSGTGQDPQHLGKEMAQEAVAQGAEALLP
jgi:hypothetical protein